MLLDIFDSDAFSVVELTESINTLPYVPSRIGEMNLFEEKGIRTTSVAIENLGGTIRLLPAKPRGGPAATRSRDKRKLRSFTVPHIPYETSIMADDVLGVRRFGSEDEMEGVSQVVNDEMAAMLQDHEATWEFHRLGALKGIILDGDGTTELLDIFDAFGITQETVSFDFADEGPAYVLRKARTIIRLIQDKLGATVFRGVHALCGNTFFDHLVDNAEVRASYYEVDENSYARDQKGIEGAMMVDFGGITWENYRGSVGSVDFIDADKAHFFPIGVPGLFKRYNAPADFVEAVGTVGKNVYAKQERQKFDRGIDIHTQSNPLHICTRPSVLIEGTDETSSGS